MTAAVTLDRVSCIFGTGGHEVRAVDGVDLTIEAGEFFTLLGPSGSGKTTALRMIGGFTLPTAGRILIGGEDVTLLPPYRRPVNTVFQDYALFPHMSIRDNVAYGLMVRKVGKAERERCADELLAQVEPFVRTTEGQRILRKGRKPDLAEVTEWIQWAANARPMKAAYPSEIC